MKTSKSSLFLMELIVALLFFSISAGICVQLFVAAHTTDDNTINGNYAAVWSQNLAEAFVGCNGDIEAMRDILGNKDIAMEISQSEKSHPNFITNEIDVTSSIILGYNSDYEAVNDIDSCHFLSRLDVYPDEASSISPQGGYMLNGFISVLDNENGTVLYELKLEHYVPLKGGAYVQ